MLLQYTTHESTWWSRQLMDGLPHNFTNAWRGIWSNDLHPIVTVEPTSFHIKKSCNNVTMATWTWILEVMRYHVAETVTGATSWQVSQFFMVLTSSAPLHRQITTIGQEYCWEAWTNRQTPIKGIAIVLLCNALVTMYRRGHFDYGWAYKES